MDTDDKPRVLQQTYPTEPYWGGRPRIPTIPPFIYEQTPVPLNLWDVKAKLALLNWEVDDIDRQLDDDLAKAILMDNFAGNVENWENWKQRTKSCRRIKGAQIYIYLDWQKHTERVYQLQHAPITEAFRLTEKLRLRVAAAEEEMKLIKKENRLLREKTERLEAVINEVLGIREAC